MFVNMFSSPNSRAADVFTNSLFTNYPDLAKALAKQHFGYTIVEMLAGGWDTCHRVAASY